MFFKKEETKLQLFSEAKILEALRHPNIIHMREFHKMASNELILILEYAEGGDLMKKISEQENFPFSEELLTR